MAELFSAAFPDHVVVTGERPPHKMVEGKWIGGGKAHVLKAPVTIKGLTRKKALKYAHVTDATVTDSGGNVIAKPKIKLTDLRTDVGNSQEMADLRSKVEELTALLAGKANKPGPKKKA